MQRRTFMQQTAAAGAGLLASSFVNAKDEKKNTEPFHLNYGIHYGMFENSAGKNFIDQIKFAYDNGFRSIEDNGFMDRDIAEQKKIGDTLASLGMNMGVFVVNFDHWPVQTSLCSGKKEWKEKFLKSCTNAVDCAKRSNATWMTVVPGNYARELSMGLQTANVIDALRAACEIFEKHKLVMVLEPLSDTPDLFLRHSDQAYAVCKAVNSPSCKILFDMYHMQRNEGNIINNIDAYYDEIGYFQIGDNPGRNEPTTGEMNYKNIFKHIYNKNYKGVLGMEHGNAFDGKEGEMKLIKAYRWSDD
ncbi:MAG TPA: TIM barrel protein, partial [Chitinophagaceae bacterium]|nr:TIM barrel protein [Chitinophagaceae bacterium]